jgi:hypothetical protein
LNPDGCTIDLNFETEILLNVGFFKNIKFRNKIEASTIKLESNRLIWIDGIVSANSLGSLNGNGAGKCVGECCKK